MIRQFTKLPKSVDELAHWYMRYISPVALVAAVLLDHYVLLRRVDLWSGNLLLLSYIVIAAGSIVVMNLIETGRWNHRWILKVTPLIPVVAQFAFGGLFSGYFSLYSRSAAVEVSWIFVILLAFLLIGNERFVRFYMRFTFQLGMFFTVLFSFLIFFLPVVFKQIGPWMFLASGFLSVLALWGFYRVLVLLVPERATIHRTKVARIVAVIFLTFNLLYFTGAMPPLPLALKDAGVYHSVERSGDGYRLTYEPLPWYSALLRYNTVFHREEGQSAYVFTSVFAPSGLSTTILHEWQYFEEDTREWVTQETVPFAIQGGREGGYRGYSIKGTPREGEWRVNVLTRYGQLIGRVSFRVVATSSPPLLAETVR